MWSRNSNERRNRIALELHEVPATRKMSLLINDRVVCETDFRNPNERKLILLNWEEKYSLFEKRYCISIS
ncbi:MAG TPA: hypothetical protein VD993_20805 [Chitinophagaceae bacterium]|nr:hypothetical protein [Chitinophagaceae bacterium]